MAASLHPLTLLVRRAGTLLVLLALCGVAAQAEDKAPAAPEKAPLPSVVVAAIEEGLVDKQDRFIGTIKAIQSVELKARVEGFLTQLAFQQGAMVTENELLYQIEQAPFLASLESAKADLAVAQADQAAAEADLLNKQLDLDRQDALIKKGDTSQAARDKAKAQRDESAAAVAKTKASVLVAKASIDTAQINLGYTTMTSPIAGRIGPTKFTEGNLVNTSSGTLATVVQLDPIRAVFSIPSASFVRVAELSSKEGTDAVREKYVPQLILPTGETYPHEGKIAFIDNQVDARTGTIAIYADFSNPEHMLLPGQFISAVLHRAEQTRLPLVPASAIQRTRDGEQVYVVGSGNRVEVRDIKTSTQVGTFYAVTSGLQIGDIVIVTGEQKVKAGMVVNPVKQSAATSPTPAQGGAKTPAPAAAGAKPESRP
ncbi:MAG: efflux RND transporter periplasmic adaptor subunit [Chromatiaceae bacterium]|nr:efflux RND transporter periplasmic adaptor subunit [Chromatiaceae bacterium]